MGEHGMGVKVRWGNLVSREKGTPRGFRGVAEDLKKFLSPPKEKHSLFMEEELMVSFAEVRGGRWVMSEGKSALLAEGFTFTIELAVQEAKAKGRFMGMTASRVGVRIKVCLHENRGKNLIFGCGVVQ
jgi:hypothetical protein